MRPLSASGSQLDSAGSGRNWTAKREEMVLQVEEKESGPKAGMSMAGIHSTRRRQASLARADEQAGKHRHVGLGRQGAGGHGASHRPG